MTEFFSAYYTRWDRAPILSTYDEAARAIAAGHAIARSLWVIVTDEHQRDSYALRPMRWEGPGEYQHVVFDDHRGNVLVKLSGRKSL